ncbi:MAG: GNAT family N-acetyltransferase [Alphaproteobacteria bacterium]|nr:GNAT family N-acetyltransferase [Alphaproteobacteria bacterium]
MTVTILDLRSLHLQEPERCNAIWQAFRPIYAAAFPEPSEREDETTWLRWLDEDDPPPQPLFDLSLAIEPSGEKVIGGTAYEYYRGSRCGIMTYLVVHPEHQRRGVGRALVAHACARLRRMAHDAGAALAVSFTEAQDPSEVDAAQREIAMRRLEIYAKLGARRLALPFVQPALAQGKLPARHMALLALDTPESSATLPARVVLDFLREYYRALEIAEPDRDADFRRTRNTAGTLIRLQAADSA